MSIALERGNRIGGAGFIRGISCIPIYDSPEVVGIPPERRTFGRLAPAAEAERATERPESASCSSSIGRNSDSSAAGSSEGEESGEAEVQSTYKGPLDTMDALEDSLPVRRGISEFYRGKSKSFTSLADAVSSSPSAKDLAKPENPYTRKRKSLLALSTMCDRPRLPDDSARSTEGGMCKRPAFSSRGTSVLTASTSSSESVAIAAEMSTCRFGLSHPCTHRASMLLLRLIALRRRGSLSRRDRLVDGSAGSGLLEPVGWPEGASSRGSSSFKSSRFTCLGYYSSPPFFCSWVLVAKACNYVRREVVVVSAQKYIFGGSLLRHFQWQCSQL